ncbi:hypothetical protein J2X20_005823 [Pelomonas saccharophila]|uniref:Protein kinase domain-containing protein n=1 Tax=Roseateles saccharophilus TaxID=304 RepID=A0ABU1YWB3_ROSSA|nr:serine/threonine-protein kinase [Roseateles saccharophilus]MDR7273138.1 hypothetical protein [Roseateles saccharophilus]
MIAVGQVVDDRFEVKGVCSAAGGMGAVLHVRDRQDPDGPRKVLKFCKDTSPEMLTRFRREVRLMYELRGNPHVMTIHHCNVDHSPPYFVMDFYERGDLFNITGEIQSNFEAQERVFMAMLDCVEALHERDVFHRDIKPQNFLFDGSRLVISDLGLSAEVESMTRFTRSADAWGTAAYLPPEFHMPGGFKSADAASDVFMVGKSFYALLTGVEFPFYMQQDHPQVPKQLRPIIERCCRQEKGQRYNAIADLRASLRHAYDAIHGRVDGPPTAAGLLTMITKRLGTSGDFSTEQVHQFIEELQGLDEDSNKEICFNIPQDLCQFIAQQLPPADHVAFLKAYRVMVDTGDYGWSFAETIADNMARFFYCAEVKPAEKTEALRIAIIGAHNMHRFAAMETCMAMVKAIDDDELAQYVRDLIVEFQDLFIADTDPNVCRSIAIRNALVSVRPPQL